MSLRLGFGARVVAIVGSSGRFGGRFWAGLGFYVVAGFVWWWCLVACIVGSWCFGVRRVLCFGCYNADFVG